MAPEYLKNIRKTKGLLCADTPAVPQANSLSLLLIPEDCPSLFFFFFIFLGLHPRHMEVHRLGVKSELQLLAYTTAAATATQDPSHVCDLHHSSCHYWILNPLRKARDRTCVLMDTSQVP